MRLSPRLKILVLTFVILTFSFGLDEGRKSYRTPASAWNVVPSRSLSGLHYIFKNFQYNDDAGLVKVTGPVIEITEVETSGPKIFPEGFSLEIDLEDFEDEQTLGQSVFQARSSSGKNVGTAFLVGKDLVLTNRHLLGITSQDKKWECGEFSVGLNHRQEQIPCIKVRFCSPRFDYCVVQLKKMSNGLSVGVEVRALRLARLIKSRPDASLLHIGNAAGLGLQASRGRGIKVVGGEFHHYAPTLNGSSGAPLFDEKGQVVGINWGHTGKDYGQEGAYNRGVLTNTIYQELKKTHPNTLNEIRSFRSWFRREKKHRDVKVDALPKPE
jgi:S1-C subfamily serine protease